MLWRRTPEGKGGRRWRGWNHPDEKKKKKNLFMSVVCADDACVKMNHSEERKKMNKIF